MYVCLNCAGDRITPTKDNNRGPSATGHHLPSLWHTIVERFGLAQQYLSRFLRRGHFNSRSANIQLFGPAKRLHRRRCRRVPVVFYDPDLAVAGPHPAPNRIYICSRALTESLLYVYVCLCVLVCVCVYVYVSQKLSKFHIFKWFHPRLGDDHQVCAS